MRDVILKSRTLGYSKIAVISEKKGNPSRMEILDFEGDSLISMDITVTNSFASGRIRKKKLHLRWELNQSNSDIKKKIISIIGIPEDPIELIKTGSTALKDELKEYTDSNLILVKEGKTSKAVVEFHDQEGQITGPRIYVHKCLSGD